MKESRLKLNVIQLRRIPEVAFFMDTFEKEKITQIAEIILLEMFFLKDGKNHQYMTDGAVLTQRSLRYLLGFTNLYYNKARYRYFEQLEKGIKTKTLNQIILYEDYFKKKLKKGLNYRLRPEREEFIVVMIKVDRYGHHKFHDLWRNKTGNVKLFNSIEKATSSFRNNVKIDYFHAFVVDVTSFKINLIIQ